jgi:hypothetical protein
MRVIPFSLEKDICLTKGDTPLESPAKRGSTPLDTPKRCEGLSSGKCSSHLKESRKPDAWISLP